jgi:hypothetical protein
VSVAAAPARALGWLSVGVGVIAFVSVVNLVLFFLAGDPFGTINDLGNAAVGVLSGLLAWTSARTELPTGAGRVAAVAIAVVGAGVTVVGSVLVLSEATGFLLAGLVTSVGFALIGLWLVAFNWSLRADPGLSGWLPKTGIAAGTMMAAGLITLPGILMRVDDMVAAPGWLWIGFLGWLGIYVMYPLWSIWLGGALLQQRRRTGDQAVAG